MLPAALALKLDPLIRRLATDHDGERLATLAALERVLRASGFAFHDLAGCVIASAEPLSVRDPTPFQPVPHAFIAVDALFDCSGLTAWEVNFLHSVGRQLCRHRRLTDKQHAALDRLWGKYQGRARMSAKVEVIEVRPVSNAGNLKALVTIKAGCFNIRGGRVIQQPANAPG